VSPLIVDTTVLVDHLRGHIPARALLLDAARRGRPIASSWLCRLEVRAGALKRERRAVDALVRAITWIAVDEAVLERADALAVEHAAAHRGINAVDYVIAATCLLVDGQLATMNVADFPMIPQLRPAY
jgi:predicted nucleic acid-binding protein